MFRFLLSFIHMQWSGTIPHATKMCIFPTCVSDAHLSRPTWHWSSLAHMAQYSHQRWDVSGILRSTTSLYFPSNEETKKTYLLRCCICQFILTFDPRLLFTGTPGDCPDYCMAFVARDEQQSVWPPDWHKLHGGEMIEIQLTSFVVGPQMSFLHHYWQCKEKNLAPCAVIQIFCLCQALLCIRVYWNMGLLESS